jgi:branched-chain amino acid transport system permease protein
MQPVASLPVGASEERRMQSRRRYGVVALAIGFMLLPLVLRDAFFITLAVNFGITLLLTLSLNLVVGYSGQFSLAHSAFFGIGAYVPALLFRDLAMSPWLSLPIAIAAGALLALLIGIPVARLRGYYLAVSTFAFAFFVEIVVRQGSDITGGAYGIQGLPAPTFFGWTLQGATYFPLVVIAVLGVMVLLDNLMTSSLGRAILATRDNAAAAGASGINSAQMRLLAFVMSAAIAALAGWLQCFYFRNLNPLMLSPEWNFFWIFIVFIGGMGNVRGIVCGTLLLTIGPELFGFATDQTILATGVVMVLVALFAPRGLGGLIDRLLEDRTRARGAKVS